MSTTTEETVVAPMTEPTTEDAVSACEPVTEETSKDDPATEESTKKEGGERKRRERADPKPCDPPDAEEYEEKKWAIESEIEEIQVQVDEISRNIDAKQAERSTHRENKKVVLDKLLAQKVARIGVREDLQKIRAQFSEIATKREGQRNFLRQLKQGLKFTNVVDLDAAVNKINFKLASLSLDLNTQKKLIDDLSLLKGQRMNVMRYAEQYAIIQMQLDDTTTLATDQKAKAASLSSGRDNERAASGEINELRKKERTANSDIEGSIKQRNKMSNKMYKLQQNRDYLTRRYNAQERDFVRYDEFRKYQNRVRQREERTARYKAQQAAYEAENNGEVPLEEGEEPVVRHPYAKELATIADLMRYCKVKLPKGAGGDAAGDAAVSEETKVSVVDRNGAFKGKADKAFVKDSEDTGFDSIIGTGKKTRRKRTKKVDTTINHIPDVFANFKTIGVEAPLTTTKLPEVIAALSARQAHFETCPPREKKAAPAAAAADSTANDAEEEAEEKEERTKARRKSILLMDGEQTRRVAEAAQEDQAAKDEETGEREERLRTTQAAVDAEQEERVKAVTVAQEEVVQEEKKERRKSITMAVGLAEAERTRRMAEAIADKGLEAQLKKESIAAALSMATAEQNRRVQEIAESSLESNKIEAATARESLDAATASINEEQLRRIQAAASADAVDVAVEGDAGDDEPKMDLTSMLVAAEKARLGL